MPVSGGTYHKRTDDKTRGEGPWHPASDMTESTLHKNSDPESIEMEGWTTSDCVFIQSRCLHPLTDLLISAKGHRSTYFPSPISHLSSTQLVLILAVLRKLMRSYVQLAEQNLNKHLNFRIN